MKKLYKSDTDSIIWGIIGGIGEYFEVDPTILRLGFVVLALITGLFPCLIAYIVAYFIIPDRPAINNLTSTNNQNNKTPFTSPDLHTQNRSADIKKTLPEIAGLNIQNEEKDRYMPGERPVDEYASELAVPEEFDQGLKKPQWPLMNDADVDETPNIDAILANDRDVNLDDLIDE